MPILRAMSAPLRILMTNNTLAKPAGTELSALDYAVSLAKRGHSVAVFSTHLGEIAERLRGAGVAVVDDLNRLQWKPQVIHGHHEWETTIAALRFGDVPVVSFCRGPYNWQEAPCRAPNVVLWAAVDEACRDRLTLRHGVSAEKVELVLNGVDLERFKLRATPVAQVRRVLIFSNYASEQNYVPAVRAACEKAGAELTVIGSAAGNIHPQPHEILGDHDVVFAKGKAALEALAVGSAVVVCDAAGLGPLVTPQNLDSLRRMSFGNPCMTARINADGVAARLAGVNAEEVARTAGIVRDTCGLKQTIDRLMEVYARALTFDAEADAAKAAEFASAFLLANTQAYKLGRKTQEFWHESREPNAPDELDALKVDRILDSFFNAEAKRAKLMAQLEKAQSQVLRVRKRVHAERGFSAKLRGFFSRRSSSETERGS